MLPSRDEKDDGNGKKKTEISKTKWVPICNQVTYNFFGNRKCIISLKTVVIIIQAHNRTKKPKQKKRISERFR